MKCRALARAVDEGGEGGGGGGGGRGRWGGGGGYGRKQDQAYEIKREKLRERD